MNSRAALHSTILAAALATLSSAASATYVPLDGWQLRTPTSTMGPPGIGRLNLVSGSSTVEQEVDSTGNVFAGAKFTQSGMIYSVTYTPENMPGFGDGGSPAPVDDVLTFKFSNLSGHVTTLPGTGFQYAFDSGSFSLSGTGGTYATGSVVGGTGDASQTSVIGGFNGNSDLFAAVLLMAASSQFDILDNTGTSLRPDLLAGTVRLQESVNNNVTNPIGGPGVCSFDATTWCQKLNVASAGDLFLVRQVRDVSELPEPGSLALVGAALLGAGLLRKRTRTAG